MATAKKSSFSTWYSDPKNREALNERRRERYHSDKKYRKKVLANTREWRESNPRPRVVTERTHLSTSGLAEFCGCSLKTIHNLEAAGLIPYVGGEGKHRRYTKAQAALVDTIVTFRKDHHYREEKFDKQLKVLVDAAFKKWGA